MRHAQHPCSKQQRKSARGSEQREVIGEEPAHLEAMFGTQAGRSDASATTQACAMSPGGTRDQRRLPLRGIHPPNSSSAPAVPPGCEGLGHMLIFFTSQTA